MGDEADSVARAQEEVVAFLSEPSTYGGIAPKHIETHLSHVFVAGERALKLKKAIRWSVVDYGTIERRQHFCRREIEVNSPFAGALYRGVVPIVRGGEGLSLGGAGRPVDYVVEMRRFADGAQLDELVDSARVTPALIDATADAIAAMHEAVPIVRQADRSAAERSRIGQLAEDIGPELSEDALRSSVTDWGTSAQSIIARRAGLIDRRARHGFVRRCHGDLHLSNICLFDDRPIPFDAIEFSEDLATIDVLYDLAFVLVDLRLRGREDLSVRLLSRYLERTRDYAGLALLPLYLSMRAMVRALVGTATGRDPGPAVRGAAETLSSRPQPRLSAIGGLSGSGKTTLARALSTLTGAVVVRSDATRKRLFGLTPEAPLEAPGYTRDASARVYRRMLTDARRALAAGWPVILDATFLSEVERERAGALAEKIGVPFEGLWLEVPAEILTERVGRRRDDASDADKGVVEAQLNSELGTMRWTVLDGTRKAQEIAAAFADLDRKAG